MRSLIKGRHAAAVASGIAMALMLSACGGGSSGGGGGGDGVDFGATKEEYQKAFESIDPITLTTQTMGAPGTTINYKEEIYIKAVEEWSDGKITFDVTPASGIAPPAETGEALETGLIDIGVVYPSYDPSAFPAYSALLDVLPSATEGGAVTTIMHSTAVGLVASFESEDLMKQYGDHSIVPLLPFGTGAPSHFYCGESHSDVSDFEGAVVTGSSASLSKQSDALGASFSSIPYNEYYEGLQRGVVDCVIAPPLTAAGGGIPEVGKHFTQATGLAFGGFGYGVNQDVWDSLPLVAQQLLFDRLDIWLTGIVESTWTAESEIATMIEGSGGSVVDLSDAGNDMIAEANEGLLDAVRDGDAFSNPDEIIDRTKALSEDWIAILTDLGFDSSLTIADIPTWIAGDTPDLQEWAASIFEKELLDHRPK